MAEISESFKNDQQVGRGPYAWQVDNSTAERNRHMYHTKLAADVAFLVGPEGHEEVIQAHRYLLVSCSPVFEAMFDEAWDKKSEGKSTSNVAITDITVKAFNEMLRYIYYEETNMLEETAFDILYAAKKYQLLGLLEKCREYIKQSISDETVCAYGEHSMTCVEDELLEKCIIYFRKNAKKILESQHFLEISAQTLKHLIEDDCLKMGDEKLVYDACMRWALHKSATSVKFPSDQDLKSALGDLFYCIRFANMAKEDLYEVTRSTGLLTLEEKLEIYESMLFPKAVNNKFSAAPRVYKDDVTSVTFNRFQNFQPGGWSSISSNVPNAITFTLDRDALFVGIGLYKCFGPQARSYRAELFDQNTTSVAKMGVEDISTKKVQLGTAEIWQWNFKEKMAIIANQKYTVSAYVEYGSNPVNTWPNTGTGGVNTLTANELKITFENAPTAFVNQGNLANVNNGQLPQLYFEISE